MVETIEVTKVEWLKMYSRRALYEIFGSVDVGTEKRFYAITTEGQGLNPDGYTVLYVVN